MSIPHFTKVRLLWLFNNAKKLNWSDENHPYRSFYMALERSLEKDDLINDMDIIYKWTSGRYSEVFAHQLTPFDCESNSNFSVWETVGEIHAALKA